ncbi:hypothetical protein Tco_0711071 [Tanacetum coccineum]
MKRMGQDKLRDSIWEHDNDLEEDQEDDGDDRDTFDITHFKSGLVGHHAIDDDGIFVIVDFARKLEAWLKACGPKSAFHNSSFSLHLRRGDWDIPYVVFLALFSPLRRESGPDHHHFLSGQFGSINMRMGQDKLQDSIWEHDNDLEEDQEDDGDDRDTFDIAMVDEEADPTRDLEEPERLLVEYPHFMEIHVHSVITKLEPFIHTQPLSPLYRIFESYKSSTKLYKVDREMKFPSRTHFKSGLVGHLAIHNDGIFVIVDFARRSKLETWLRECCLFIISSKIQGSVLFKFYYFHYISIPYCTIGTLYKSSGEMRVELPLD